MSWNDLKKNHPLMVSLQGISFRFIPNGHYLHIALARWGCGDGSKYDSTNRNNALAKLPLLGWSQPLHHAVLHRLFPKMLAGKVLLFFPTH